VGVTVLLITCSYKKKEFIRIGYYVNVEYETQELRDNPPERADISRMTRNILAEKPKVTRFPIDWVCLVLVATFIPFSTSDLAFF
jgi:histone chaperone ASF1